MLGGLRLRLGWTIRVCLGPTRALVPQPRRAMGLIQAQLQAQFQALIELRPWVQIPVLLQVQPQLSTRQGFLSQQQLQA